MYRYGQARPGTSLPLIRTCGAQRGILPCRASCYRICLDAMEDKMRAVRKSDFGALARSITDTQSGAERVGYVAITNCARI